MSGPQSETPGPENHGDSDRSFTVRYQVMGSAEQRMSLGQLLDWIDYATGAEREAVEAEDPGLADRFRRHLADAEAALSRWRTDLADEPEALDKAILERAARSALEQRDLQLFRRLGSAAALESLARLARMALAFDRPWDRVIALEEVVLAGEVRALGFERARERRSASRGEFLNALEQRLVDVLPVPDPETAW